jgi:5-methylcytosine-specific restriction endonuclease McrA
VKLLAICSEPGCSESVERGRCPAHSGDDRADRAFLGSRAWKAVRAVVLNRDDHRCQAADDGDQCTSEATQVDHVVPRSAGGSPLDPENLVSYCPSHHSRKTQADKHVSWPQRQGQRDASRTTESQHVRDNVARRDRVFALFDSGLSDWDTVATTGESESLVARWRAQHERRSGGR